MNDFSLQSRILYQNSACVVVNKLSGEAAEGAGERQADLQLMLKDYLKSGFAEAVNRLDVPVTGCSLFALNSSSLKFLNAAFADKHGSVIKKYWAVIEKPDKKIPESGELIHWIETNTRINKSFAYNENAQGRKKASLAYKISGEGKNYLFLEVRLLTGRHHQIRSQFEKAGLHIKGDLKYGAKRSEKDGGIRLHAGYLSFNNPLNKDELIEVISDPPVMDNLWQSFKNHSLSCPITSVAEQVLSIPEL